MIESSISSCDIDVDGIPGSQRGGQLLSDYIRLERAQLSRSEPTPEAEAGARLSRRVLTCCWGSMMMVLTTGLNPPKEETNKGILNRDGGQRRGVRDTVVLALEGLHKAATLSNVLGTFAFSLVARIVLSCLLRIYFSRPSHPRFAEPLWLHLRSSRKGRLYRAIHLANDSQEGRSPTQVAEQGDQYSHVSRAQHGRSFGTRSGAW